MKRNILNRTVLGIVAAFSFTSCDYLDIVPVEQATIEDASKRPEQTLGYLYSCYSGLNNWNPVNYQNEDVSSTDEYVLPNAGNWCTNAYNIQTNQRSSATGGDWHWRYCGYDHIRICHLFLDVVKDAAGLTDDERKTWAAEAKALIAYYHFMVLRKYGPCPIIDHAIPENAMGDQIPGRSHYDAVTKYIVDMLDEAMNDLPDRWTGGEWGRIDKVIAKAIKARALLYAASPLWNGNDLYESGRLKWENTVWETEGYGRQLVNPVYSREKWETARDACEEALNFALDQGLELYQKSDFDELDDLPQGFTPAQKEFMKYVFRMRYAVLSRANATQQCQEVVWGTSNQSSIVMACLPRRMFKMTGNQVKDGWSGVSPTLNAIEKFYTKNGYPIKKDPAFPQESEWFDVASNDVIDAEPSYSGKLKKGEIINLNTRREPRFYAWMAYSGGEYGTKLIGGSPLILEMRNGEMQGYNPSYSDRDYCRSGYLCQKWAHPSLEFTVSNGSDNGSSYTSPRPLIRMAELYLNLAECEAALENNAAFMAAINPVRERAGIKALSATDITGDMTATDWVRNERFVEFFGEGIRFYDLRRWMQGNEAYGNGFYGLDMNSTVEPPLASFNRRTRLTEYKDVAWDDRMYIMPLYFEECDKSENMIQAPGY